jgi:pyruvate/2-oxoglutarate dehydrogenase complex dihydrolipoamide dehydrogenase (E3) component
MTACARPGSGIYAAGDVTGRDQFVYMAAYGAKLATKNALNGNSLRYDNSAMPPIVSPIRKWRASA